MKQESFVSANAPAGSSKTFLIRFLIALFTFAILFYTLNRFLPWNFYDEFQIVVTPFPFYAALRHSRTTMYLTSLFAFIYVIITDMLLLNCSFGSVVTISFVAASVFFAQELIFRTVSYQRTLQDENHTLAKNLKLQIDKVRRLSEILPICRVCNKLRTDETAWQEFEDFLKKELHTEMVEGICEDCVKEILSDFEAGKKETTDRPLN